MSGSNLSTFAYIPENSLATPGLWNSVFSILSANDVALNSPSVLSGGLSLGTQGLTINVNSGATDFIFLNDSTGLRSNYIIGSFNTGTSDGLNIFDASGNTMIVSFSKQSVRFYQNIVGPVFDLGGALTGTYNVATFGVASQSTESRIQAAITQAALDSVPRVYLPSTFYPYSGASISFDSRVQMVREGGNFVWFDALAYGARGNSVIDDTIAFQAAINGAIRQGGGIIFLPSVATTTTYLLSGVTVNADSIRIEGATTGASGGVPPAGSASVTLKASSTASYLIKLTTTGASTAPRNCAFSRFQIDANNVKNLKALWMDGGWYARVEQVNTIRSNLTATSYDLYVQSSLVNNGAYWDLFENCTFKRVGLYGVSGNQVTTQCFVSCDLTYIESQYGFNYTFLGGSLTDHNNDNGDETVGYHFNSLNNTQAVTFVGVDFEVANLSGATLFKVGPNTDGIYNVGCNLDSWAAAIADGESPCYNYTFPRSNVKNSAGGGSVGWLRFMYDKQTGKMQALRIRNISDDAARQCEIAIGTSSNDAQNVEEMFLGVNQGASGYKGYFDNRSGGDFIFSTNGGEGFRLGTGYFSASTVSIGGSIAAATQNLQVAGSAIFQQAGVNQITITSTGANGYAGLNLITDPTGTNRTGFLDIDNARNRFRMGAGGGLLVQLSGNDNSFDPATAGSTSLGTAGSAWSSLYVTDGVAKGPTLTFGSEASLGWYRSAASVMALSYGGLGIKAGTNNSCGTAVLGSNGSVNVANTYVAAGDLIFLTDQTAGGTLGDIELGGIRAGSGFTILSTSITDTSTVAWLIIRPH